jgi:hypothetical protein
MTECLLLFGHAIEIYLDDPSLLDSSGMVVYNNGQSYLQASTPGILYIEWTSNNWENKLHFSATFWALRLQYRALRMKWCELHAWFTRWATTHTEAEGGHFEQSLKIQ